MNDYVSMVETFKRLPQEVRNSFIIGMLSEGYIDYKSVSEGYVNYLEKVREKDQRKTLDLGNAMLSIVHGKKKEVGKNIADSYNALNRTNMFNLDKKDFLRWIGKEEIK